ncbi:MAG TPA: SH3 domain-containing protein [Fimbriiglobus sp.]|nr:SH3 domain-containing protein [Fimbriiglobus sp.]
MRLVPAAVLVLALAAPAAAQPAAHLAEVTADSVTVRSGPSDSMPETGTLFRGARVVVDHEENEHWVAIQPPRGQVSWIKHLFLKPPAGSPADGMAYNAVVTSEGEVEVAVGRPGSDKPLDVRRTRIPDQTIVLVIGKPVKHADSTWFPIEPPDGDFRYLPKTAVRRLNQPVAGHVVNDKPKALPPESKPAFEPATASIPGGTTGGVRPADWPNHPLWQQAEQAERQGDYARAETLYLRLAAEMNQPGGDAELANLCYARVHAVREKQRGTPRTDPGRRDLPPAAGQWVGPGVLRRTGLPPMNGRTAYSLDGPQGGRPRCYAVAGPGVDLDRFKGYEVQLYGEMTYPGDLRGVGLLNVTRVQVAR